MAWQVRHQGSPKAVQGLSLAQVVEGLRDGLWEVTDEVKGPGDTAWAPIEEHPRLAETAEEVGPVEPRPVDPDENIDMNSMIDVTLVLLIFFIVASAHMATLQKIIPIPTSSPAGGSGAKTYSKDFVEKYMIRVEAVGGGDGQGTVRVEGKEADVFAADGKTLDVGKLQSVLRPHVQSQPPKTDVVLKAEGVSWGTVVAIQDAAKAAGVRTVHHLLPDDGAGNSNKE